MPPLIAWGAIFGFILGVFNTVASTIVSVVRAIIPILASIWDKVFVIFDRVSQAIGLGLRAAARFGSWVWHSVISRIVPALRTWWERFSNFLARIFRPVLDLLHRIGQILDSIWERFIQPVLDVLEKIRSIFSILAQLGVDWARAVAEFIEKIIQTIVHTFQTIRDEINTVETFISDLLTPEGWIKPQPWLKSTWRWAGGMAAIFTELGVDEELGLRFDATRHRITDDNIPMKVGRFADQLIRSHPAVRYRVTQFAQGRTKAGEKSPLV